MTARFGVLGHAEITARGAFLMGKVEEGTVRIGATVETGPRLTIAAVEFADKRSTHESWVCLRFTESPAKSELEQRFPVGTAVTIADN
jgi:hypothetical protein